MKTLKIYPGMTSNASLQACACGVPARNSLQLTPAKIEGDLGEDIFEGNYL